MQNTGQTLADLISKVNGPGVARALAGMDFSRVEARLLDGDPHRMTDQEFVASLKPIMDDIGMAVAVGIPDYIADRLCALAKAGPASERFPNAREEAPVAFYRVETETFVTLLAVADHNTTPGNTQVTFEEALARVNEASSFKPWAMSLYAEFTMATMAASGGSIGTRDVIVLGRDLMTRVSKATQGDKFPMIAQAIAVPGDTVTLHIFEAVTLASALSYAACGEMIPMPRSLTGRYMAYLTAKVEAGETLADPDLQAMCRLEIRRNKGEDVRAEAIGIALGALAKLGRK